MGLSNPVTLVIIAIPTTICAAAGGWLAELRVWRFATTGRLAPRRGAPSRMLSPLPLVGIVAVLLAGLALVAIPAGLYEQSPDEALVAAFRAANDGDYEAADEYLSREAIQETNGDTRSFWDGSTNGGTVADMSAQVEEQAGETASVQIFLQYDSGGSSGIVVPMVRREGRWEMLPQ